MLVMRITVRWFRVFLGGGLACFGTVKCWLLGVYGKLVRLMLVMPATIADSDRSFSAVRRIKTYLRSMMSQQRLNHFNAFTHPQEPHR